MAVEGCSFARLVRAIHDHRCDRQYGDTLTDTLAIERNSGLHKRTLRARRVGVMRRLRSIRWSICVLMTGWLSRLRSRSRQAVKRCRQACCPELEVPGHD